VKIGEYYEKMGRRLTIFGGIPSNLLLAETTSDDEFEAYLDHLFKVIAPGKRVILGSRIPRRPMLFSIDWFGSENG